MLERAGALYRSQLNRRKAAQALKAYSALISSPSNLGSVAADASLNDLVLPASARLAVSLDKNTSAGDITVTVNGRAIGVKGGASGTRFLLGFQEKGRKLSIKRGASALAGALSVYVIDDWGHAKKIAGGTFS